MGAESAVLSLLWSLLLSMGLMGGSYNDIATAFPDNSAAQNQILYSVANDPTLNSPYSANWTDINGMHAFEVGNFITGSAYLKQNFDALMQDLGFAIVDNNVQYAVSQGYSPSPEALNYIGTLEATTGEKLICTYVGSTNVMFRNIERIPDGVVVSQGVPTGGTYVGDISVFKWQYDDIVVYSTSLYENMGGPYVSTTVGDVARFEVVDNVLRFRVYRYGGLYWDIAFGKQNWINQGIAIDDALVFDPTDSVLSGAEYLSFGDADNPIVSVSYDPTTGTTTYQYKDGTTSTTPPATLSDTITLSPSITQPLTNYIINEGDVTNIYNPDAAIPSDSSIPFDFTSLGQLLNQTFIPSVAFPYQTIYNRLLNKATFLTVITDLGVRLKNITPKRPEYFIYGVDMFGWIETIGQSNFVKVKSLIAFALKVSMLLGSIALVMKTFHVNVGKGSEE